MASAGKLGDPVPDQVATAQPMPATPAQPVSMGPSTNPAEAVYHPASVLGRMDASHVAQAGLAPAITGEIQQAAQRIRDGLSSANLGQYGVDAAKIGDRVNNVLSRVTGGITGPRTSFPPNTTPGAATPPPAARVAALTARKTKIDTAVAGYQGDTGNTARVQAFGARADARIGARIAGTPYTRPTAALPARTAGTTPIRDVRTSAGLPTRPKPVRSNK